MFMIIMQDFQLTNLIKGSLGAYMALFNTAKRFGSIVKLLHWTIFILVLMQYSIMSRRAFLPEDSFDNLWYMLLHKSVGLVTLGVATLMLISSQFGQRPPDPEQSPYQNLLAKTVQVALYACLILMPLGGILMTAFSGRPLNFFGLALFTANAITPNTVLAGFCYAAHIFAAKMLLGLVVLHTLGALYHHIILKDNVLKRMWFGC